MNCLIYVLRKIRTERTAGRRGGYILIRRSYLARDFGITNPWHPASWVPHFLHRDQHGVVTQYQPTEHQKWLNKHAGLFRVWLNLWSFEGEVTGDDEPGLYMDSNPRLGVIIEIRRE